MRIPETYYTLFYVLIAILVVVVALLKGLALWRSARNAQKIWFWVFVFVNTVGILEIIYLLTNKEEGSEKKIVAKPIKEEKKKEMAMNEMPAMESNEGTSAENM